MENLDEIHALLQRARPLPPKDPFYEPPSQIMDHRDKFLQFVRKPTTSIFRDESWFDHHWEWLGPCLPDGQMFIRCYGVRVPIHRFIWLLYRAPLPKGHYARPICGNDVCVNEGHLRPRPRQSGGLTAKLQDDIRWLFAQPNDLFTARRLAEVFHVSERRIYQVLGGPDPLSPSRKSDLQ